MMEGVKNFVVKRHVCLIMIKSTVIFTIVSALTVPDLQDLPITRIVDGLMERKTIPEIEDYQYLDPKAIKAPDP